MIKLTTEQKAYAIRWAANYLEQHEEQDTALESLRYCADMTEKYGEPDVIIDAYGAHGGGGGASGYITVLGESGGVSITDGLSIECITGIRGKLDKTDMSKDYMVNTDDN